MAANPNIALSIGYVVLSGSNGIDLINYYTNDVQGVCRIRGTRYNSLDGKYYHDPSEDRNSCIYKTEHSLMRSSRVFVDAGMLFDIGRIFTYPCVAGDNCDARTCSTFASTAILSDDIYIRGVDNTAPNTPTGLSITPGNGQLNIQWNPVSGSIAVYYVAIIFGGSPLTTGYTLESMRNVTISGLTNGATYSVEVRAITYNNVAGDATIGSGTPEFAVPVLTSISITPTSKTIGIDGTVQLSAVCKDETGKIITCPTLSWLSSDDLIATVSSTGLVTGLKEGTASITASAEGKTGISIISVSTTPPPEDKEGEGISTMLILGIATGLGLLLYATTRNK